MLRIAGRIDANVVTVCQTEPSKYPPKRTWHWCPPLASPCRYVNHLEHHNHNKHQDFVCWRRWAWHALMPPSPPPTGILRIEQRHRRVSINAQDSAQIARWPWCREAATTNNKGNYRSTKSGGCLWRSTAWDFGMVVQRLRRLRLEGRILEGWIVFDDGDVPHFLFLFLSSLCFQQMTVHEFQKQIQRFSS